MSSRKAYVDIFKALAIILIVIGHTTSPLNPYLYLFHVPAFFFISGYTAKLDEELSLFFPKRILGLLIPFIIANIVFVLIILFLKIFSLGALFYPSSTVGLGSIKFFLINLISPTDLGGATWFLFVLFEVSMIAKIVTKANDHFKFKPWVILFFLTILLIATNTNYKNVHILPYEFDLALRGVFYYMMGYFISKRDIFRSYINPSYAVPLAILVIAFYGRFFYQPMNWPTREFSPNPIHNIFTSLCGIYLLYISSRILEKVRAVSAVLTYIGKRTLAIVIFHFLAFKVLYVILNYLNIVPISQLKELVPPAGNTYWFGLTVLSITICLIIDFLFSKFTYLNGLILGRWSSENRKKIINLFIEKGTP